MKLVSVIIPVYRVEKYIAATVESVLAQTYKNFELLIVDDGSPDKSIEICQQFADNRIKIIRQENGGVCAARNTGIRNAQGEYLAFLDGDDLWSPEKLEKHVEHLENSPLVGLSFSRSAFVDEAGKPLGIYQMPKLKDITPALILRRNPIGNGSAPVIRQEVFAAIKFQENCYFDEQLRHFEDVECWLRIALQTNWQIEGIPQPLTQYRVNSQGASTNLSKQIEDLEKVLEKTRSYAPDLIAQHGNAAKAYELRKLARWAVRLQAGPTSVKMAHQALSTHWRIIIEEPRRTFITLAAAYLLFVIPRPFYRQIEALALKSIGGSQKRRILKEGR
ncbi:glycosyltransferase family 2 protein [Aetokthonos hydrillicola Thurmond2011]|jgi:glycosyltransferase involved in cell wall biosynthesis|uniref:Glycosyltransferase family 2 protein n=1 Tax=Aetokthonos hydrillicola Thurmond2011 TaxID=2712845 RepID=A0AAP5I9S3_9CYAN|nr:glycosyltransferase family A protein [Aetokthonos hydrillicola]MBO3459834.1 glycosyltransferase family 2 protein [Aetokthonos hydrillicola CCALA 1050]MBW4584521.1 glycosyltransferase family 2 protein [Aetokthonos hydrillicola CCALA 1050]MDR9895065.1 glycosyltransferase family 2 protein [Aetokthonos hydrillicola Thurmond2011]